MYGTLHKRDDIVRDESWFGIKLRKNINTRWEEFTFVRDELRKLSPGRVIDAACGFEPGVHIMPEIMARDGWQVEAVDLKEESTGFFNEPFPDLPNVNRVRQDIKNLEYEDATFDAYVNISVLEHFSNDEERKKAISEGLRVLKPGGVLIITMDNLNPSSIISAFRDEVDFGESSDKEGPSLSPSVTFITGRKL